MNDGKIRILFIEASNSEDEQIKTSEEYSIIQKKKEKSIFSEYINLKFAPSVERGHLTTEISSFNPHIVHFAGHGEEDHGFIFRHDDEYKVADYIEDTIEKLTPFSDNIHLIIFNVCYTKKISEKLSSSIKNIIASNKEVYDDLSIKFISTFYEIFFENVTISKSFSAALESYARYDEDLLNHFFHISTEDLNLETLMGSEMNVLLKFEYEEELFAYIDWACLLLLFYEFHNFENFRSTIKAFLNNFFNNKIQVRKEGNFDIKNDGNHKILLSYIQDSVILTSDYSDDFIFHFKKLKAVFHRFLEKIQNKTKFWIKFVYILKNSDLAIFNKEDIASKLNTPAIKITLRIRINFLIKEMNNLLMFIEEVPIPVYLENFEEFQSTNLLQRLSSQKVFKVLSQIDDNLAKTYLGALRTFSETSHYATISQAAFSLGQVCTIIIEIRNDILRSCELLPTPPRRRTKDLIRELEEICKKMNSISNTEIEIDEVKFQELIEEFEEIILQLLRPSSEVLKELRKLTLLKSPTEENLKSLERLLIKPSHSQFFFINLEDEEWFDLLKANDYFKPPSIKSIEGHPNIALWPQLSYLIEVSSLIPKKVIRIIEELKGLRNRRLYRGLILCLLNMPSEISEKAISIVREWISYSCTTSELVVLNKLTNKYILEEKEDPSYKMLNILFSINQPEVTERNFIDNKYYYLFSNFDDLIDNLMEYEKRNKTFRFFRLLCTKLDEHFHQVNRYDKTAHRDYSEIWRRSIPLLKGDWTTKDMKNQTITFIYNHLIMIGNFEKEQIIWHYKILNRFKWTIFTRLRILMILEYPNILKQKFRDIIVNKEYFLEDRYWNEYSKLLKSGFHELEDKDKNKIFEWIKTGPSIRKFEEDKDYFVNKGEYEKYKKVRYSYWVRNKSAPIIDYLPQGLKDLYKSFVKKDGKPEARKEINAPTFFPQKPRNYEQIRKMSCPQLIKYFDQFNPNRDEIFSEMEELGRYIRNLIEENPRFYLCLFSHITDIENLYLEYIIRGFTNVIDNLDGSNWSIIIDNIRDFYNGYKSKKDLIENISLWERILELFGRMLYDKKKKLNKRSLEKIWTLFSDFISLWYENFEEMENIDDQVLNYVQFAINTVKGKLLDYIISYNLYFSHHQINDEKVGLLLKVQEILERLINPSMNSNKIIWSILSFRLHNLLYLNQEWTEEKFSIIFNLKKPKLWRIAWFSYIEYNSLNKSVFGKLRSSYIYCVKNLQILRYTDNQLKKLAFHVMLSYIHELEEFSRESVLNVFFKNAPLNARSRAMWASLPIYDEIINYDDSIIKISKLFDIWKYRIEFFKNNRGDISLKEVENELKWFASIFVKLEIKKEYLEIMLDILDLTNGYVDVFGISLLKHLKKYVVLDSQKVLKAIQFMINGNKNKTIWLIESTEDVIIEILDYINEVSNITKFEKIIFSIKNKLLDNGFFKINNLDFINDL